MSTFESNCLKKAIRKYGWSSVYRYINSDIFHNIQNRDDYLRTGEGYIRELMSEELPTTVRMG